MKRGRLCATKEEDGGDLWHDDPIVNSDDLILATPKAVKWLASLDIKL